MYNYKLKNNLNILAIPVKGIDTITSLFLIKTGSKNETDKNWGVSHLLEHMMFKGTKKRKNPMDLISEMENIGSVHNAFTGKEHTGYYIKSSKLHIKKNFDLLSDIIINSIFNKDELKKEKKVVLEEINMYKDHPQEQIDDFFEQICFKNTEFERNILGTKNSVKQLKHLNLLNYYKAFYTPENSLLCIAGALPKKQELKILLERYFGKLKRQKSQTQRKQEFKSENNKNKHIFIKPKDTDQAHLMIGFKTIGSKNKDKYKQSILADMLGGGMSSRINYQIRDQKGWAYYTYTCSDLYTYMGSLVTGVGLNKDKIEQALKIILQEYKKIKNKIVTEKELKKSKEHIKGRTLISLESSDSQALYYGKKLLLTGKKHKVEKELENIDKITVQELKNFANKYLTKQNLYFAVIGPYENKQKKFEEMLIKFK